MGCERKAKGDSKRLESCGNGSIGAVLTTKAEEPEFKTLKPT